MTNVVLYGAKLELLGALDRATAAAGLVVPPAAAVLNRPEHVEKTLRIARLALRIAEERHGPEDPEKLVPRAVIAVRRAVAALEAWEVESLVTHERTKQALEVAGRAAIEA
jgi:hypothetical protein